MVFVIRSFGFPRGMAATNRVRLLGRALIDQGVEVSVLCTRVTERVFRGPLSTQPSDVLNEHAKGICDGIPFRYTTGSTVRSTSFAVRRYREVRSLAVALFELGRMRRERRLDCAYLPEVSKSWRPSLLLLRAGLRALRIPVVVEPNELPGRVGWLPPAFSRRLSHLVGADGVAAISEWLVSWARHEAARVGKSLDIVEIPIVVDMDEQQITPYQRQAPLFVYSSSAYYDAVAFIFRAMAQVWQGHPGCRLTITGVAPDMVARIAAEEGVAGAIADGRILVAGYVDRRQLLELYRAATALLIPLPDDLGSRARFPTKIGEYMAAARPVVTTAVGEIPRFLSDGETAYVCAPTADAYAAHLAQVLDDPDQAERVGLAGRRLAEKLFDYKAQGPPLAALIERVSGTSPQKGGNGRDQ